MNSLQELDLSKNSISQIELKFQLPNLEELDVSSNLIQKISTSALKNLDNLYVLLLSSNKLQKFDLSILGACKTKIATIDLSKNQIKVVENSGFDNFPVLDQLNLAENELGYLGRRMDDKTFTWINEMPVLTTLNLNENQLEKLPLKLNKQENSENLRLDISASNNFIEWLSKEDLGTGANILMNLDVSNNKLQGIQNFAFSSLDPDFIINLENNKWSCCHSKYLYSWLVDRTSRSKYVSENGINGNLKCVSNTGEFLPMDSKSVFGNSVGKTTVESNSDDCFNFRDFISITERDNSMELRLENDIYKMHEMAPYSHWNVSLEIGGSLIESVKLSDQNKVGILNLPDVDAEVCFRFSEVYGDQCVRVEAKFSPNLDDSEDTGVYQPNSDSESGRNNKFSTNSETKYPKFGKDDEKMTYVVLAVVAGCLLCVVVLALGVCYKCLTKTASEKEEYDKLAQTIPRQIPNRFLHANAQNWGTMSPLEAQSLYPENFGSTMQPTVGRNMLNSQTIMQNPGQNFQTSNRRHVEDARAEFDYTRIDPSGDLVKPGGYGDNCFTIVHDNRGFPQFCMNVGGMPVSQSTVNPQLVNHSIIHHGGLADSGVPASPNHSSSESRNLGGLANTESSHLSDGTNEYV